MGSLRGEGGWGVKVTPGFRVNIGAWGRRQIAAVWGLWSMQAELESGVARDTEKTLSDTDQGHHVGGAANRYNSPDVPRNGNTPAVRADYAMRTSVL